MSAPLKVGNIIREEWLNILRDRRLFAILFLVPLLYTALFGYLYSNQRLVAIPTVVFDGDNSQLSRQIIQAFDQTETFRITSHTLSESEVERTIENGKARVGIIIPNDFSTRLKHGENVPVLTFVDGSNMLFSNSATRAANQVITTFSYGASSIKLKQQGLRDEQITATFSQIPFRSRVLYNPMFNYNDFLVYGLIGAILQQVLLLGVALTVTRDKEQGTWNRFAVWRGLPWRIAYAKTAPYFLIGVVNNLSVFVLSLYVFHLPFRGLFLPAMALGVSFVFALLGIGYLASLFSGNQVGSTQTTMLIAVPSFLLSGFTWPFEAMPYALNVAGHLLPLTYFLDGVREIFIKGHGFEMVWQDCVAMGLMGAVTYFIAFLLTPLFIKADKKSEADTTPSLSV
ncbi:ABC transporter permease [Aneurinibacillus migulanus]|uniref:ABC-2 type transport system permease protein n=1 Tax=Aneurinibacillus migulanus TaxID=47500 RepID=A0A0D1Y5B2_ANEMI|nr:ABC transporter permease [Aneurinibacillus migulanus]KIV59553.1 multidrug ABC transporter permease [Aneurinibacillus migulanus]KON93080.1 multidrug ABC transporter permease [Aneurinibacillus migulanus]MED0891033.1 ABC transporter permease [Aneurinibacillus migulanus]MED1614674.1 ABC transporter permease [Aneurinibacillus migulanus]SDK13796.1 ABC-2 type transport system permease protein [Aneurinibacillus migulanus]